MSSSSALKTAVPIAQVYCCASRCLSLRHRGTGLLSASSNLSLYDMSAFILPVGDLVAVKMFGNGC